MACTDDPDADPVAIGGVRGSERHSGRRLEVPTLADALRRQGVPPPRIVSLSLKPRVAIGLAGQGGDDTIVAWTEAAGHWATSTAYARHGWPELDRAFDDLATAGVRSSWSDADVAALAIALVRHAGLGTREDATDLLALGFTGLDAAGHAHGPDSPEVRDELARLDTTLGDLLAHLDDIVGAGRYVVGFTSDHGVAPLPERAAAAAPDAPGGRLNPGHVAVAVDRVLRHARGPGRYIDAATTAGVYLAPGVLNDVRHDAQLAGDVLGAVRRVAGVGAAYWSHGLREPTTDADRAAQRASHFPGRSGDLTFLPARHWVVPVTGTDHGSPFDYDRHVPVIFFGGPIRAGTYRGATPIDVAPTLAALAGVALPAADGTARLEVLPP